MTLKNTTEKVKGEFTEYNKKDDYINLDRDIDLDIGLVQKICTSKISNLWDPIPPMRTSTLLVAPPHVQVGCFWFIDL